MDMDFMLTFSMDNAAFEGEQYRGEVSRILERVREEVQGGRRDGVVLDVNGNRVGDWRIADDT